MTKPKAADVTKPATPQLAMDPSNRPRTNLEATRDESRTSHQQFADISLSSVTVGAIASKVWAEHHLGEIGINEAVAVVRERAEAVARGDLNAAKAMLIAQATTLDTIFNDMAQRASALVRTKQDGNWNYTGTLDATLRIAFKAQNQCRGTLQTLGELVNPRSVAFIKQANLANGPQQVNNAPGQATPARDSEQSQSNELKELTDERMDAGAQGAAGGASPWLATVDAINRAKVGGGQGAILPEQHKARRTVKAGH